MRVHYLQHVPYEGLGYIETWLKENNHSISGTRFYEPGYALPSISDIDALVIMGGPMSVYDDYKYPWLREEKIFIEDSINAGKKVLGICLGAQLVALCLGANIHTAQHQEIGWFRVQPTEQIKSISWLHQLFKDEPTVFHWHGDQFEIPFDDSFSFLFSEANNNQAFYRNENIIALQFHLEVTVQSIKEMLENGASDLKDSPYIQTAEEISDNTEHIKNCNRIMSILLRNWLSESTKES